MLKICTIYFKGLYTPDYVSNFYNSIRKHTSVPFQSVCISDTDGEADIVLPYNHYGSIKKHWHKLKFFSLYMVIKILVMILLLWILTK